MAFGFFDALKDLLTGRKPATDTSSESIETESPFDEAVVFPLEDNIDLHPFVPRDIPSVVEEYLEQCYENGFREVRIIHGRGKGVQRRIVRSILAKHPQVASYKDAPPERGGWGATIVMLVGRPGDKETG